MKESINYINNLLKKDDIVVLGCSGGPDSMALLYLLLNYRKNVNNIYIVVAHVNHNVRRESDNELIFLKEYCEKNKVAFESMKIEKYSDDNFHNEARVIRYKFFEEVVKKYNANYLMTAHHGDDLMETILMRIVRGSTLSGYSGFSMMVDQGDYKIVRPLVFTTKDEVLQYDIKNNIPYVVDDSNFKDKYTRNRYRKNVLPFLKAEDKNVHQKFLKYSNTLSMYDSYIDKQMHKVIKDVYSDKKLNISKFKELDLIFQNKIIYYILQEYYHDDLLLINDQHVELIRNLIYSKKANSLVYLPNNVKVIKSYNELTISVDFDLTADYEIEISDYVHLPNGKNIERIFEQDKNDNNYCRLNSSDICLPLYVRTRKSGDKMMVKNMKGSKKLKDIFIDSKIPLLQRDLWPIVVDSLGNIVWVCGIKKSKFDIPKSKKCDIILRYY